MMISEIEDPFDRYCAFLVERDAIYLRKSHGDPWPWTEDHILQQYRFTEVYRERDRTSLHYQKTVRDHYREEWLVLPATVLYRWFNRIITCDALFNQLDIESNQSIFERYIYSNCEKPSILYDCINILPTPHVTGAFIITGAQGYEKGIGVAIYFHEWCQKPWKDQWFKWRRVPPTLQEMFIWLRQDGSGLGSFMGAQLVADLKYLPFMLYQPEDWWTWAAPGPGSMRGLNVILGRHIDTSWNSNEWLENLQTLREAENKELVPLGLGPFHAQDTQNHLCEFSKYEKVRLGIGRPRQVYRAGE
jgi:hypothetical protein